MITYQLTSRHIIAGSLKTVLPEFYKLSSVVEINPWHNKQNVFEHTMNVLSSLERIILFDFLAGDRKLKLEKELLQEINGHTRKELLIVATLLHDCGKEKTLIIDHRTRQTNCPNHELIGSELANKYCKRLYITGIANSRVRRIIILHGYPHEVVNQVLSHDVPEKYFEVFARKVKSIYLELLLLGYADTLGSNLITNNPTETAAREHIYQDALTRFAASL